MLALKREPLAAPQFTTFAQGVSLEVLAPLEELERSSRGDPFLMWVSYGVTERSFSIGFSLNSLPWEIDRDTWRLNFHTSIADTDKVRYGQFIMDFTRANRPLAEDGRGGSYRQLFCQQVPVIFLQRI